MNGVDGKIFYGIGIFVIAILILYNKQLERAQIFFFFIGITSGIYGYRYFIKQNRLIRNGQKIAARNLGLAEYGRTMGFTRYRIICEWIDPETNKKRIFMSIGFKENELNYYVPTEYVNVYLDNKTGDYYVDALSFKRN